LCHLQDTLIGFYNRDEKCLQRGTDWVFKYSGLRLAFKGLVWFGLIFYENSETSVQGATKFGTVSPNIFSIFLQIYVGSWQDRDGVAAGERHGMCKLASAVQRRHVGDLPVFGTVGEWQSSGRIFAGSLPGSGSGTAWYVRISP
jgi:hypothetical protein